MCHTILTGWRHSPVDVNLASFQRHLFEQSGVSSSFYCVWQIGPIPKVWSVGTFCILLYIPQNASLACNPVTASAEVRLPIKNCVSVMMAQATTISQFPVWEDRFRLIWKQFLSQVIGKTQLQVIKPV